MFRFALLIVLVTAGIAPAADPLPPGAVLRLGDVRFRSGGEIRRLRFSADGATLSAWSIGRDGKPRPVAWDAASGVPISPVDLPPLEAPDRTTSAARLDGNRVLTAGPGCAGRVWDASTGRQLAFLTGHSAPVTAVAVSADGKRLATGSADGLVRVWDADTFHPLVPIYGHTGPVRTVRVSVDGTRAITTGDDRSARTWDLATGKELRAFPTEGPVELTPSGTAVVFLAGGRTVTRDLLTGLEVVPACPPASPTPTLTELLARIGTTVAFSQDGRAAALAHRDGTVGLYELSTGQCRRSLVGHPSGCNAIAFTPDGSRLLTAGSDHTTLVWAIRLQDVPLPVAVKRETQAAKLWSTMTTGPAEAAYLAMARLAAEPPVAVKMARLRLRPAETPETDPRNRVAEGRAVELLESLGTPAAQDFLEELATGDPDAHLTREARTALERLGGG